jgi:ethanolaminephosphotransferase
VQRAAQILHYLGLDHIGHLAGPDSPLVPPKLAEMGAALEAVWAGLQAGEGEPLLAVVGDHGMAEGGSHGGSSPGEVLVPLVLLGGGLGRAPRQDRGELLPGEELLQVDLAPALAFLTGVPIPKGRCSIH